MFITLRTQCTKIRKLSLSWLFLSVNLAGTMIAHFFTINIVRCLCEQRKKSGLVLSRQYKQPFLHLNCHLQIHKTSDIFPQTTVVAVILKLKQWHCHSFNFNRRLRWSTMIRANTRGITSNQAYCSARLIPGD